MSFSPLSLLRIPGTGTIDLNAMETVAVHGRIIRQKRFLYRLYQDFYALFKQEAESVAHLPGRYLELGSGGGFFKEVLPDVITSEVTHVLGVDIAAPADELPFEKNSLKGIFLLNVLHHLPDPRGFFKEAERCLVKGGKIVMIEPFNSLWARFMYKRFHHELFDETITRWELPVKGGRLSDSNQALPWVIFWRDRDQFEKEFPDLRVEFLQAHTSFNYLFSGGLTLRSLVPGFSYPLFSWLDRAVSKFQGLFPMFQTIVLRKIPCAESAA